MAATDAKPLIRNLGKWPGGIDNVSDLKGLQAREVPALRDAVNVDFRTDGRVRRRTGKTLVREGRCHSGWAPRGQAFGLFVSAGMLYRINRNRDSEEFEALGPVGGDSAMFYEEQAGVVYGSNERARFVVGRDGPMLPWGVETPAGVPLLTPVDGGGLPPGEIQATLTFVSVTGEESGARTAAATTLAEGQGLRLSQIPQPSSPFVQAIRLYLTQPGAKVFRACRDFAPGTLELRITPADLANSGRQLISQHHERVPFCRHLAALNGRMYFVPARGDQTRLCYTPAIYYGLHKPHEHYLPVPAPITGVVALADGLYVGTLDAVYWFGGAEPSAMTRVLVQQHGMVPGTAKALRGTVFGGDLAQGQVAVWWSTKGELMRAAGSLNLNAITRGRTGVPTYAQGAIAHRETNGISQIVSALKGRTHHSGFASYDRADATVFKHGIGA